MGNQGDLLGQWHIHLTWCHGLIINPYVIFQMLWLHCNDPNELCVYIWHPGVKSLGQGCIYNNGLDGNNKKHIILISITDFGNPKNAGVHKVADRCSKLSTFRSAHGPSLYRNTFLKSSIVISHLKEGVFTCRLALLVDAASDTVREINASAKRWQQLRACVNYMQCVIHLEDNV